jgi:hypothetical protein
MRLPHRGRPSTLNQTKSAPSGSVFVFNFVLLGGYYVIRPIRDNIGAEGGLENLSWMYKALSS